MARIRKNRVNFSGEGGVEDVDGDVAGDDTIEVGFVDMEIDEKSGVEVVEGLDETRDVNGVSVEGLGSESKERSKVVEGEALTDEDRGEGEVSREFVEASRSMNVEAKEDAIVEGEKSENEKEVEVARVDEEESARDENAEGSQVEEKTAEVTNDGELNVGLDSQMGTCGVEENEMLESCAGVKSAEDVSMPEKVSPAEDSVKSDDGNSSIDKGDDDSEGYSGSDGDSDDMDLSGPSEPEFQAFDLVWGKVRSHPWWPGQICDPSTSSEQAKKHFKKGSYLIAYFWDCTFAWNEASQIKPFFENFSQMEKQSKTKEFRDAISCAMDEVSRRVEFGLACSCIPKDVYAKFKTQTIVNAGVKEEASRRDGGDSSLDAASFEPLKLIKFAKQAAKLPFGRADKLELVTAWAQLSSFCRWKGYSELPEFNLLGGLLENDADISLLREKEQVNELQEDADPVINNSELDNKPKGKNISVYKRKHSEDSSKPSKREKKVSRVTAQKEKGLSTTMIESGSASKAGGKLVSQSFGKKRKAVVGAISDDSVVKQSKGALSAADGYPSLQSKKTFNVGDRIRRVATLLNGSSPIFRLSSAAPADAEEDERKEEPTLEAPQTEKLIDIKDPSPEDELPLGKLFGGKRGKKLIKSLKKSIKPCKSETSELKLVKDAPSDKVVKSENGDLLHGAASDQDASVLESQSTVDLEAQKPAIDNENGDLGHGAAKSDRETCVVEAPSSLDLEAQNPAIDNENGDLVHVAVKSDIDTCVVESPSSLDLETQKPATDNENGDLVHGAAKSDGDTCVAESTTSLDLEAQKSDCDNEIGDLVHVVATSDTVTSTVDLQASVELDPNMDSGQNTTYGDLDSKASNQALVNDQEVLACESISVVKLPVDPELNPNLDFEQENTSGDKATSVAPENGSEELVAGAPSNKDSFDKELQESLELNLDGDHASEELVAGASSSKDSSDKELKENIELNPDGDHDSGTVKPAPQSPSLDEEDSPAALILNFSDSESLPSEEYLNKIFSVFGPLNESQTELLKKTNCAKVVFKHRSDAQKAFSSAGKYSTFGPSLKSYRLKYPL